MKPGMWVAASALALIVTSLPVESFALHRVRTTVGIRLGFGHAHYFYGPVRPLRFYAPRVVEVYRVNYGSVDFNIEPQDSRIYVDGRYLGIADDFNGFPQTAKLPVGSHAVLVVAPDGREERRTIYVAPGEEFNFNLRF